MSGIDEKRQAVRHDCADHLGGEDQAGYAQCDSEAFPVRRAVRVIMAVAMPVAVSVMIVVAGLVVVLVFVGVVVVVFAHGASTSGSQMTGTSPVATRRSSAAASRFVVSSGSAKE